MKQKTITKVIKVSDKIKEKMIEFYEGKKRLKTPPYAIFQADENDTVITLYESGKVMFQGISADVEASMWEMISKSDGNLEDFFEEESNKKNTKEEINIPIDISSIGSDEVGTGDYFGPIVVTASYVTKENIPFLTELGVRDSKKLSDEKILEIVPQIIKKIPYKTLILNNKDYNSYYGKDMNMNKIKAILHNKVLYSLVNENNYKYDYIVVDQFESPKSYYNHLSDTNKIVTGITFITKAEDKCLSVACSSLISRYIFIKEIDKLSDKYGLFIPKGASSYVDDIAIKLVDKYGEKILSDVAKLNFSNTSRIIRK